MGLDFGKLERLFLDGLLQVDVDFVGTVQRHFQFSDLDLQFLLDASNLSLEAGLSFNNASIELFDFDASSFAVIGKQ